MQMQLAQIEQQKLDLANQDAADKAKMELDLEK